VRVLLFAPAFALALAGALAVPAGAAALMRKAWTRRPIRLIGLRAAKLETRSDAVQLSLLSS